MIGFSHGHTQTYTDFPLADAPEENSNRFARNRLRFILNCHAKHKPDGTIKRLYVVTCQRPLGLSLSSRK